jgi:gp16 family phage-associated protein
MSDHSEDHSELKERELMSPEQVQAWFHESGVCVGDWANKNGFSPALVYAVIKGKRKCIRGESHRIAVALGMKYDVSQL